MVGQFLAMPGGLRLFLVYALTILFGIGISLRYVIDQAIGAPVSGPGVVVMVLLAYTIFTTTLVIQRKQAARGLALGLASLTLPLVLLLLLARADSADDLPRRRLRRCCSAGCSRRGPGVPDRGVSAGGPELRATPRPAPVARTL